MIPLVGHLPGRSAGGERHLISGVTGRRDGHQKGKIMEAKVDIKDDDNNKMVADAILDSALGEHIKTAVDAEIKSLKSGFDYREKIRGMVKGAVAGVVAKEIDRNREAIEEIAKEQLTDELLKTLVGNALRYQWQENDR